MNIFALTVITLLLLLPACTTYHEERLLATPESVELPRSPDPVTIITNATALIRTMHQSSAQPQTPEHQS